jgi:hypothetical protein
VLAPDQSLYRSRHNISTDTWWDLVEVEPGVMRWELIGEGAAGEAKARKWIDAHGTMESGECP